jgi:2'-5' RNA ligase
MQHTRQQLTLFINEGRELFESVRARYNPMQQALIAAHMTLCREDELLLLPKVVDNIRSLRLQPITVTLGPPERFAEGRGLFLPGVGENAGFHELRRQLLKGVLSNPRHQHPHITLIHPRNGLCTTAIFEALKKYTFPAQLRFHRISLIFQQGENAWQLQEEFDLLP